MMTIKKSGQVWIETVLYTLIGLALMGVVLAFVMPKINAEKDAVAVEQTVTAMNDFDERVNSVLQAPGNVREITISMKRGTFTIKASADTIQFYFDDLSAPYSEPGVPVQLGRVTVLSEKKQKGANATLTIAYPENITYDQNETDRSFTAASVPYTFSISNLGVLDTSSGRNVISIKELSS